MKARVRLRGALLTFAVVAAFGGAGTPRLSASLFADDGSCLWGGGERTTYSAPYDPSEAPSIPLLKRASGEIGAETGTKSDAEKTSDATSSGPRAGDCGIFLGADGKKYFYRFVEGTRRRKVVETRRVLETPPGAWAPVWVERKFARYVDEPRLIKQIWPVEALNAPPAPCRSVENVGGTSGANGETTGSVGTASTIIYRTSARAVVER